MKLRELMRVLSGQQVCQRKPANPAIDETFQRVREEVHSIAGKASNTHAIVQQKIKSLRIADDALALSRGEEPR